MSLPGKASSDPLLLCPCVLTKYRALIEDVVPKVGDVRLIETLRDEERQRYYVSIGVSRTMKSKHLPNAKGLSLAFDLVPRVLMATKHWSPGHELWAVVGKAAQRLGLEAGQFWETFKDYPHYQLSECACPQTQERV